MIPESFDAKAAEPFDTAYMTELFNLGFQLARDGYEWERVPPDYEADIEEIGE